MEHRSTSDPLISAGRRLRQEDGWISDACVCISSRLMSRAGSAAALGGGQQHLGAADDGGKRPLGLLDGAIQVVQLLLQQEARHTLLHKLGDTCITAGQSPSHPVNLALKIDMHHGRGTAFVCPTFCGCMSAMRSSKGIVHKDVCVGRQLQRHQCQAAATMPFIWFLAKYSSGASENPAMISGRLQVSHDLGSKVSPSWRNQGHF